MEESSYIIVPSDSVKHSLIGNSVLKNVNGNDRAKELKCQVDLGSGKTKCCVQNCSTNSLPSINKSQITFVTFPKDPSRFTEWTRAIDRPDLLSYIGKKDATNLLICSKHFPESMWINSNTRIKRLHKSAVPEVNPEEDDDVIPLGPTIEKSPAKKGGLKIKKVTSLLTESAFRESLNVSGRDSPILICPDVNETGNSPIPKTGRKWQAIIPRQKTAGSTDLEKKLISENNNLKSELDKNMDYILNQKTHYEGLLSKEKQKVEELEARIKTMETSQRKLWHTYESQLQAQRTVANSKEYGQKELQAKIKLLQEKNDSLEQQLSEESVKVNYLALENRDLIEKLDAYNENEDNVLRSSSNRPTLNERNFSGEKFKDYLDFYLMKEKQLEEKVESLTLELEQAVMPEGQKEKCLHLASQHLNHMQLSFLARCLNLKQKPKGEFESRFRELCLSIYESSEACYVTCAKAFELPSVETVRKWASEITIDTKSSSSTINSLFEDCEPLPERLLRVGLGKENEIINRDRSSKFKTKRDSIDEILYPMKRAKNDDDDDDDDDEGRASDEDEEIIYTDSDYDDDEDEEEDDDEDVEEEEEMEDEAFEEEEIVKEATTCQRDGEIPSTSQEFEFMLGDEEEIIGADNSRNSENQLENSMPLLVSDSSMTTIPNIEPSASTSELKISNRKKVISSDTNLSSGSKLVFRVIES